SALCIGGGSDTERLGGRRIETAQTPRSSGRLRVDHGHARDRIYFVGAHVMRAATPAQPLLHTIGARLTIVAMGLICVLTVVTVVEYTSDVGKLRRETLEHQAKHLFDGLRSGRPPD